MRKAKPRRTAQSGTTASNSTASNSTGASAAPQPADADGLDALAREVDALATESAIRALDAAAKLAGTDDPSAGPRVTDVASDVSAHTRRLEAEIGKVLLARRPL
jgi:hypothetical protein